MTEHSNPYDMLMRRLAEDPAFAQFAKTGSGVLIWGTHAETIIWASPEAEDLRAALTGEDGSILPTLKGRARLKSLVSGLATKDGMRLERLWLDPAPLSPPVTCACRLADVNGETVLVTAIVGAIPKAPPRLRPSAMEADVATAPVQAEDVKSDAIKPRGVVRFVWQMDAQTRFIQISSELSGVVGPMSSDVLGQRWDDVSRTVVEDPEGAVASLLAGRKTWSGQSIAWAIDNTSLQVPVDWAGMPIYGQDKSLLGFRGFGLLRSDEIREASRALNGDEREVASDDQAAPPASVIDWFDELRDQVAASLAQDAEEVQTGEVDALPLKAPEALPQPEKLSSLSSAERHAFREIARALGARVDDTDEAPEPIEPLPLASEVAEAPAAPMHIVPEPVVLFQPVASNGEEILNHLPGGVLVYRGEHLLFANELLLNLVGYDNLDEIAAEGGMVRLFKGSPALLHSEESTNPLALTNRRHESVPVEVRLSSVDWDGLPASLMLIRKVANPDLPQKLRAAEADLREKIARVHELEAILDTATDGVIAFDETGRILSLNRSAEALFGYDQREVVGDAITVLLAPESHIVALDYLEGLRSPGVGSLMNDGREVTGRVRQGGTIPLFMTMGSIGEASGRKFCAVLRDMTAFKKAEMELLNAKRIAEEGSAQKSDFLAKISHEIRTPLNAIIGFAELMREERFGPIGNERYKDYLKDVYDSGAHVISLVNDLLDLAKIEAGRMELSFGSVNLNELTSSCFALLQPQAARDRIVMRTSFAEKLPPVVADERSIRQIVLNLVSNAIKFTDAGGQVILSTALTDRGEVAFRVRDTGIGMSADEVEAALEPFRQIATARKRGGTGLGLPLTKALVEANRGSLQIASTPREGTLVEVIFPPTRVLAE